MARDVVAGERIGPCGGDQVVIFEGGGFHHGAPVIQLGIRFGIRGFIHNIVHCSAECVQGADSRSFFLRQQSGCKGKGFAML